MQKNETRSPTYTIHKNKLKMYKGLKYKMGNHKNIRGIHRQQHFRHMPKELLHRYSPRAMETKEKKKKWDYIKIKSTG